MNIKEIIQRLQTAMNDAMGQESHFESWLTQNEGICDAIDALKELDTTEQKPVAHFGSAYVNENGVHVTTVLGPVAIPQDAKLYTTSPQHVLMAEHWKSMYEQLKASAYTPDDGALTEEQINQLRKTVPQRPWVSLTHEDIDKAIEDNQRFGGFRKVGFAYDLEAILKEKNI